MALSNLGVMYMNGFGIRQDKTKAKELFGMACDLGYQDGCDNYRLANDYGIK